MRKTLLVTLLGSALAVPLAAHADGIYIGANIGQGTTKLDDSGFTSTTTSVSRHETNTGFKLYGGYEFTRNWGVELGYAELGELNNVYSQGGVDATLKYKAKSLYVAGTGTVAISDQFSLFGKLGYANNRSSVNFSSVFGTGSDSFTKSGVMFGAGATYSFNKNIGMSLEYDDFGKTDDMGTKGTMWSLGVRYKF
jgi:OOP family OmpA-OmpF porin